LFSRTRSFAGASLNFFSANPGCSELSITSSALRLLILLQEMEVVSKLSLDGNPFIFKTCFLGACADCVIRCTPEACDHTVHTLPPWKTRRQAWETEQRRLSKELKDNTDKNRTDDAFRWSWKGQMSDARLLKVVRTSPPAVVKVFTRFAPLIRRCLTFLDAHSRTVWSLVCKRHYNFMKKASRTISINNLSFGRVLTIYISHTGTDDFGKPGTLLK
jgi:hypothetical protein